VPNRGFTLIELLVALLVMATVSGVLVLTVGSGGIESRTRAEAERLRDRLLFACERAELTGRDLGLLLSAEGYAFAHRRDDLWELEQDRVLAHYPLPEGIVLGTELAPFEETLATVPQTLCLASGERSPLALTLSAGAQNPSYRLRADWNASIELDVRQAATTAWIRWKQQP